MTRLALCALKHLRRHLLREMTRPDPAADPADVARVFLAVHSLIATLERRP
jgi:hypothetical protein